MTGVITSMARDSFFPRCHLTGGGGTASVKCNGSVATGISGGRTVGLIDARPVVFHSAARTPGNASTWLVCMLRTASINTVTLHDNGRRPSSAAHSHPSEDWAVWSAMSSKPGQVCAAGAPDAHNNREFSPLLEGYGLPTQHDANVVGPSRRKDGILERELFCLHSPFGEPLTSLP